MMKTLFFLLCLCTTSLAADELSVMSFNIRYGTAKDGDNAWPHRKELVAETVARTSPDLLGLQESLDFQIEFLAGKLPNYQVYSVPRTPDGGESCAIFFLESRFELLEKGTFWLSETPEVVASKSWDSSLPRIVSWVRLKVKDSGKEFVYLNTHFDHKGKVAREESAKLIRKRIAKIAGEAPFIITGDFNCGDGSAPHLALVGDDGKFVDTFRHLNPEVVPEREGTFTGFAEKDTGKRIDWIVCSPSFEVKSAAIDRFRKEKRLPSDHYPVTAILKF